MKNLRFANEVEQAEQIRQNPAYAIHATLEELQGAIKVKGLVARAVRKEAQR